MRIPPWLAGWKLATVLSWVFILGLFGMTIAEISDFGSIVQFFGDTLEFSWEDDADAHHYRILLTTKDMTSPQPVDVDSSFYSQENELEIEVEPGLAYNMRVQALSEAGNSSEMSNSSPTYLCMGGSGDEGGNSNISAALPGRTTLGPAYPNPFNSTTTIPYNIASETGRSLFVSLKIYNTLGQQVRTLVDDVRLPGQYRAAWDAQNDQGAVISTGTYICLLKAGDYSNTRMVVFAK